MIGKTVKAVLNEDGYGNIIVVFTDGTAAEFAPFGWETEGVEVHPLTLSEMNARIRERCGHQQREWLRRLQRRAGIAKRKRRCAEMKARLNKEAYDKWFEETYGLTAIDRVMRDTYLEPVREALNQESPWLNLDWHRDINRQFYKGP